MAELDHLVCVVTDLDAARREFAAAGFDVHSGGRHDGKPTANLLVPLADGAYLELLAFAPSWLRTPVRLLGRTPLWPKLQSGRPAAERPFAEALARAAGFGLVVLRVDDLDTSVADLRKAGFAVDDPLSMTRTTPDGRQPQWRLAAADDPDVPLLIEDTTAVGLRIPSPPAAARAVQRLAVPVVDVDRAAEAYRVLLDGDGSRWRAGTTAVELVPRSASPMEVQLSGQPLPVQLAELGLTAGAGVVPMRRSSDGVEQTTHWFDAAAERLAAAVRFRTVSYENHEDIDESQFAGLGSYLEQTFPRVHAELELQRVGHSRLYRWAGRSDEQPPALLCAHMDVVPVDDLDGWTHPPFDGVVADGFVWGRGTIDDKGRVIAILEAVEAALAAGEQPERTVYLAFGHDEEIGGYQGAAQMARLLAEQGVKAGFLLDEGGVISTGLVDGVRAPVASIMAGEKGFATVRLSTSDLGGHPSMPPRRTAVGRLARAVTAVQERPMPLRVTPPVRDMVLKLAPFMRGPRALLAARAGRIGTALAYAMIVRPESAALVRTTTAPTVISGGVKANVLPQRAEALVNFRILHGDTIAGVLEHCRKVVRDDDVQVELASGMQAEPSPLSPTSGTTFDMLADITRALMPGVAVTTGLVPGATDARHYHDVAEQRYNFAPVLLTGTDLSRIHGTDERLSLANHARVIEFYRRLLRAL